MSEISILAEGIGKEYVIGGAENHYDSFREMVTGALKSPFRKYKTLSHGGDLNRFWALQDIDFSVNQGDVIGVIGHNGAGKSTLLKVISRITAPTTGRIEIHGRVASLLEVGTGFHPELTGRENIYLNGSILGMSRRQINQKFDEIVEFADVTKFLDTPVKRYSSGMHVRLAFSVAAHLDTDVLLVDEVLAVGDQKFQQKCLGKLGDVSSDGRTVLFVSHNLASVAQLCSKALVLDKGKVVFNGDVLEGISVYNGQMKDSPMLAEQDYLGNLYHSVQFSRITLDNQEFQEGQELDPLQDQMIKIEGECAKAMDGYRGVFSVRKNGQLLFSLYDCNGLTALPTGRFESHFKVPAKLLLPGEYTCSFGGVSENLDGWLWTRDYRFNVAHRWAEDYDSTSSVAGIINVGLTGNRVIKG